MKTKLNKRKIILQTALETLTERGFEGITIESVAETLGYTKPALYYYFKNKDDLLISLVTEYMEDAHETIRRITEGPGTPRERLLEILRYYVDSNCNARGYFTIDHHITGFMKQMPEDADSARLKKLSTGIPRRIIALITEGIEAGDFREEDPAVLGSLIFSLLAGVLTHMKMASLSKLGTEGLKEKVCDFALKGITV